MLQTDHQYSCFSTSTTQFFNHSDFQQLFERDYFQKTLGFQTTKWAFISSTSKIYFIVPKSASRRSLGCQGQAIPFTRLISSLTGQQTFALWDDAFNKINT